MLLLEPVDLRGNRRRARIDPPLVGLDDGRGSHGLALWIVKKQDHIVMQPALVPLQGQRVAAFTLLGDGVEPSQNLAANAFIDPAPFGCYRTKGKATAVIHGPAGHPRP